MFSLRTNRKLSCLVMKKFIVLALSSICLMSAPALAKGGGGGGHSSSHSGHSSSHSGHSSGPVHVNGYDRKDGTHVQSHDRSTPGGSNSGNYGVTSNEAAPSAAPGMESKLDDEPAAGREISRSATPSLKPNRQNSEFQFPLNACGDAQSPSKTWYPVFIDGGDLTQVQQQFCRDAIRTIREDTSVRSIQVGSFSNRERAAHFAQVVGGEVGQPTLPAEQQAENVGKKASEQQPSVQPSPLMNLSPIQSRPQTPLTVQPTLPAVQPGGNAGVAPPRNSAADPAMTFLLGTGLGAGCLFWGYRRLRKGVKA
jgi:hypothetical protein